MVLSADSTQNFSMVGVTWKGATPLAGIAVQVRTKSSAGTWAPWTDMTIDYTQTGKANEPVGTEPYWVGPSDGVEVTVTLQNGIKISGAKITLIDPNKEGQDAVAAASTPSAVAGADAPQPPVYSRAAWGADESLATWDPEYAPTIKAAVIHHTVDTNNYSATDVPGIMRSIYYYHAVTRGWGDIGYNAVVDKFGHAWEGRKGGLASTVIGGHAAGFNSETFGVSMLGNYDEVPVPAATSEIIAQLIAWKFSLYGVDPTGITQLTQDGGGGLARFSDGQTVTMPTIMGHRDVDNTACPGQYGYTILQAVRSRVAQIMTKYASPRGTLESATAASRSVTLSGWSYDPTAVSSTVSVAVYRNGVGLTTYPANTPRPDVNNVFGIPGNHGYSINLPAEPFGNNTYCTYALDIEGLGNKTLGCRTVFVGPLPPIGALDAAATGTGQTAKLQGWAFDPSNTGVSVMVAVYRNGVGLGNFSLTAYRPDVNAAYSLTGNRGYDLTLPGQPSGTNTYCVYALDTEGIANTTLGCRTIVVQSRSPVSNYESIQKVGGQVIVTGWSFDPDDPSRQGSVAIYKDGVGIGWFQTAGNRADVNAAFGISGSHGFTISLPSSGSGTSSYCLYAIDSTGAAANQFIGCRVN